MFTTCLPHGDVYVFFVHGHCTELYETEDEVANACGLMDGTELKGNTCLGHGRKWGEVGAVLESGQMCGLLIVCVFA